MNCRVAVNIKVNAKYIERKNTKPRELRQAKSKMAKLPARVMVKACKHKKNIV